VVAERDTRLAQSQQTVAQAKAQFDEAARALEPVNPNAEARGATIRAGVENAERAAREVERTAYEGFSGAADPAPLAEAFKRVSDNIPQAYRPLLAGVEERENLCSTALSGGVALLHPPQHDPHMFEDTFVVMGRTPNAIPFGGPDGQTTRIFFLVCSQEDRIHLHLLARLGMICYLTDALLQLNEAEDSRSMYKILLDCEAEVIVHLQSRK
jgi:mannitol/fructose-specific phosphotransferase system IIA component